MVGPRLLERIADVSGRGFPPSHGVNPCSVFAVSEDRKVIVDPHFVVGEHHIARLKELRAKAGKAKIKYDELIRILETPKAEVPHPSLEDMAGAWR